MGKKPEKKSSGGTGGSGGSGYTLTKEEIQAFRKYSEQQAKESKKKEAKRQATKVMSSLANKGIVFTDAKGNVVALDDYDATSSSDSDSDGKSRRKKSRRKVTPPSPKVPDTKEKDVKILEMGHEMERLRWAAERAELQAKAKEFELVKTKAAECFTPTDTEKRATRTGSQPGRPGATPDLPKLSLEEWERLTKDAAKASAPVPDPSAKYGIFGHIIATRKPSSKSSPASTKSHTSGIAGSLSKKLEEADKKQKLSLGVSVPPHEEDFVKKVAIRVAQQHYDGAPKEDVTALQTLLIQWLPNNQSKKPATILTAILRAILSRDVGLTEADLCTAM